MTWFDKLKDFVKVEIKELIKININIINEPKTENVYTTSPDKKTVNINFAQINLQEKKEILKILKEGFDQDDILLIENKANYRIKDIRSKLKDGVIEEILNFYRGKIEEQHWRALRASLYVRKTFEGREGSVDQLKKDLVKRFGEEGKMISNLCTAGYFDKEGYISQLYKEIYASGNFEPSKFKEEFKKIVTLSPFAEFVYIDMTEEELCCQILYKISVHKKYGI
ncbi:MAG: hypothetical protein AABX82_04940, partial [Nanoarchaeota archaeon]